MVFSITVVASKRGCTGRCERVSVSSPSRTDAMDAVQSPKESMMSGASPSASPSALTDVEASPGPAVAASAAAAVEAALEPRAFQVLQSSVFVHAVPSQLAVGTASFAGANAPAEARGTAGYGSGGMPVGSPAAVVRSAAAGASVSSPLFLAGAGNGAAMPQISVSLVVPGALASRTAMAGTATTTAAAAAVEDPMLALLAAAGL